MMQSYHRIKWTPLPGPLNGRCQMLLKSPGTYFWKGPQTVDGPGVLGSAAGEDGDRNVNWGPSSRHCPNFPAVPRNLGIVLPGVNELAGLLVAS